MSQNTQSMTSEQKEQVETDGGKHKEAVYKKNKIDISEVSKDSFIRLEIQIKTALEENKNVLETRIHTLETKTAEVYKKTEEAIKDGLRNVETNTTEAYTKTERAITEGIGNLEGEVRNARMDVKSQMEAGFKQMQGEVRNAKTDVKSHMEAGFEKMQGEVRNAKMDVKSQMEAGFKQMQGEVRNAKMDVKSQMEAGFKQMQFSREEIEEGLRRNNHLFRCYMLLALKTILLVAIVGVYCSNKNISEVGPCKLKAALDSIHLNYFFHPCADSAIKMKSGEILSLRLPEIIFNLFSTLLVLISTCLSHCCNERNYLFFIRMGCIIVVGLGAIAFLSADCRNYTSLSEMMTDKEIEIDYSLLQTLLLTSLEENYKSDNITTGDMMSTSWNIFFIRYDCCAVREVLGTTNDFDNTPWCTTNGTCQATASQIPKTCCKFVTKNNYQNAPSNCHASVNPGTYKQNCVDRLRKLSIYNIKEWQVFGLWISLSIKLLLQVLAICLSFGLLVCEFFMYRIFQKRQKKHRSTNRRNQEDNLKFTDTSVQ